MSRLFFDLPSLLPIFPERPKSTQILSVTVQNLGINDLSYEGSLVENGEEKYIQIHKRDKGNTFISTGFVKRSKAPGSFKRYLLENFSNDNCGAAKNVQKGLG